jgi:hypothetical protein
MRLSEGDPFLFFNPIRVRSQFLTETVLEACGPAHLVFSTIRNQQQV